MIGLKQYLVEKAKPKINIDMLMPKPTKKDTRASDPLYQQKSGTSARDRAKSMGLEYYGFGYWGRNDKVLYHTEGGELKPVDSKHYVVTAQKKHNNQAVTKKGMFSSVYKVPSTTDHATFLKHAAEVEKSLKPKERMALEDYVSNSSGINGQLVDMAKGTFDKDDTWNDFTPEITHLDNVMKKSVMPTDTVVYRGIPSRSIAKKMIEELKKTNLIHMPTFVSTSFSPDSARGFQYQDNYMIIKIPEGANALPIHYGKTKKSFESEFEVVLPRDSVLKLVRVEKRPARKGTSKSEENESNYRFIFELQ